MNPTLHSFNRFSNALLALCFLLLPAFVFGQLSVTISGISPSCNSYTNGEVSAVVSGGVGPYFFIWNNGGSGPVLQNIPAGNYAVTVTDGNGDQASDSFTLTQPSAISVSVSVNDICSGNGNVTASVSGGSGGYSYNWSNGATTANPGSLGAGFHCLTVTDANGCQGVGCVIVPAAMSLSFVVQGLACFNFCDASAEVIVSGGTAPFTYIWSNGFTGEVNEFLGPGTYSVTVTDVNGCDAVGSTDVGNPFPVVIDISVTNPPCGSSGLGSATATVTGGEAPYSYFWSNGATTSSIFNLQPGTYFLTVTDFVGCTEAASVTIIPQSDIVLNVTAVPSSQCGFSDGSAMVSISGGTPPFSILWSNGGTGNTITNLAPGNYSVTVTGADGCGATAQVTVGGTPPIDLMIMGVSAGCAANGSANAMVTPGTGTPPFTYLWNTGATTSIITNILPGDYSVTVTDAAGCTAVKSVTVTGSSNISASATGTNVDCFGGSNGSATASSSGATGPVTYLWSNGGTTQTITGIATGTYFVTVTDPASGCTAMATVFISQPTPVQVTVIGDDAGCIDLGSATATASGGTPPYTYSWSNGATSAFISGLNAGTYTVTATDANGCTAVNFVVINQDDALDVQVQITNPISGKNTNDGVLTATVNGGVGPYTYNWNTGATTATISNLGPGTYTVTVTDANGCTGTDSVTLIEPACIGDRIWNDVNRNGCQDPGEFGVGGVTINLTGTDIFGNTVNQTTVTANNGQYLFNNLAPGNYQISVVLPTGFAFSPVNACGNNFVDSDIFPNGSSAVIPLAAGECNINVDGGIHDICLNIIDPGTICCDQVLCGPGVAASTINSVTPATGGGSPTEYMWMASTIGGPFNTSTWYAIPGATNASYNPGVLYTTTYFIRCAKAVNCEDWLESNSVVIEIGDDAQAIISGDQGPCVGDVVLYSAPNNGPGATYSWNFGPWASPSTSTAQQVNVTWLQAGLVNVTLTVTANGCTSTGILPVFISNSPIICGSPLIINVDVMNQSVMVSWKMEKEPGNYGFNVQRSADGKKFDHIAFMPQSNSNGMNNYAFADHFPKSGNAFYRVEVLKDGKHYMYSNVERISRFGKSNFILYPNPATDLLIIESGDQVKTAVQMELMGMDGRLMLTRSFAEGDMHHPLDVSGLQAGSYLIRFVYNDGTTEVMRVVKQ